MPTSHSAQTLLIEGADAIAFAQAQFSSKVEQLDVGRWQFSAWLDAQGRVRALFHLARIDDEVLLLLLRGGEAEPMAEALRRFVFRSRVKLAANEPRALGTGPARETYAVHREGDAYILGCGEHSLVIGAARSDNTWRLPQVRAGWPWLPDSALQQCLPPALSLHRLQAVAVDKGCYPGQEIVARLHYRGGHKRHMHCVVLSQPLPGGTVLRHGDKEVAQLLDVASDAQRIEALAIIGDDVASQFKDGTLTAVDGDMTMLVEESWPA
ncbi:folate-binding protein [Dyella soli]|uniref:Folate-binding protein n=2 Tax=Dyella soli TaxID=522319 RepID=A0A4R0YXF3_9GAMM|nr:folate-binding protein [Dyella soli]